jgi:hypothetical protein
MAVESAWLTGKGFPQRWRKNARLLTGSTAYGKARALMLAQGLILRPGLTIKTRILRPASFGRARRG